MEENTNDILNRETYEYNIPEIMEEVSRISIALMIGKKELGIEPEPFYGHFFTGLIKSITPPVDLIDTLAVGERNGITTLYINPFFWNEILNSLKLKLGGIKHEILHIVYLHIFRYKLFKHKLIFNIAADLVVNQLISRDHLIDGAVFLDNFPELNLLPHQHVNYYYDALMDLYKRKTSGRKEEESKDNISWGNLKGLLDEFNPNQRRHILWRELDELSSAEKELLESAAKQSIENTLRRLKTEDFGKLPAGLQEYLREFEKSLQPAVNWKRVLRLFANNSSKTRVKNTLRRPSKRYGTNPGIKVKKKQKILIAVDTSGSIGEKELQEFFNEIYHIWKQGTTIQIVECDTDIHQTYFYKGETPKTVQGGGGTAFDKPIRYANDLFHPDALIYFTDGYGPNPELQCNCPLLWLINPYGCDLENLRDFQGRKLRMN